MTRKKPVAKSAGAAKSRQEESYGVTFVNIPLSDDDKAALRQWSLSADEVFDELSRLTENGYKVSLSVDLNNTGGIASLTGKAGCVPETNKDRCLVSRGPDIHGAILCMLYKLQAYCHEGEFPQGATHHDSDFS